jgi:iron complex transport system permease protein
VVFYFGLFGGALAVPVGGFVGAMLALLLLYALAGRSVDAMTLILAGVAINAFAGALTSLALNLAPSPWAALEIVFWMLGSLADRSMSHVIFAAPFAIAGMALVLTAGRALDALSLGQDTARSLGFSPRATTVKVILGTGLAVGAMVSVTGMIGFVGLVVPHLLRPWLGHHPSRLLLPSALTGAAVLLAADVLVRMPMRGPELKLGVVTALIGAPFFLHLILKTRRSGP